MAKYDLSTLYMAAIGELEAARAKPFSGAEVARCEHEADQAYAAIEADAKAKGEPPPHKYH
jgi:hypothetical protein